MQSDGEVRASVADLVAQLTGSDVAQIQPTSRLKELGIDSLLAVELADELGRRHGLYLSDQAVDSMRTVEDAVRAVAHHDGATPPTWAQSPDAGPVVLSTSPAGDSPAETTEHDVPLDRSRFTAGAITTALTMIVIGGLVGVALGFGASTLLASTGLGDTELPPISASPTADASEETGSTPTPTQSPTAETSDPAVPEPSLAASSTTVSPGTRFTLTGAIPAVGPGAQLQVQVKDPDSDWDDFPVTLTTGTDGGFSAEVYTSRTGTREWRLIHIEAGEATPSVAVTIG